MTTLRIEARDPLIFRDGRPNDGRSESRTLDFPVPSILAGAVRTQLGSSEGRFNVGLIQTLLTGVSFRGPLLAFQDKIFAPAPADALLIEQDKDVLQLRALQPIPMPPGAQASGLDGLSLVGPLPGDNDRSKPFNEAPRFWSWEDMERWLQNARTMENEEARALCNRGLRSIPREERIHVALGPNGTAEDGKLFAAEGLRLLHEKTDQTPQDPNGTGKNTTWTAPEDLSFLLDVTVKAEGLGQMPAGFRPVGGERRLARWSTPEHVTLPSIPDWLLQHVSDNETPVLRVVLLSPAYVESSLTPPCLQSGGARVIAAKVDRPRTISGWDMQPRKDLPQGWPKKTRRLAAAGSVYWVELSGDRDSRTRWVKEHWMQNIGDDPQLCRDGFGLAVIGIGGKP
jgi:CRISPR-associated protein Cmr3